MKNCPRCGAPLHTDLNKCLACDWGHDIKKKIKKCPKCGDVLVSGVCYRCGYRKRFSKDTCPYCKQKLISGRCKECRYVAPSRVLKAIIIDAVLLLAIYLLLGDGLSTIINGFLE